MGDGTHEWDLIYSYAINFYVYAMSIKPFYFGLFVFEWPIISNGLFQTLKTNLPQNDSSSTTIIFVNNACILSMITNIHAHF